MASNAKPGAIVLAALAFAACFAWWLARAQVGPATQPMPSAGSTHEFHDAADRKDTIACMDFLGRCQQQAQACDTERSHCEADRALAHQQLQAAYAEIADLRPKAALPVCSGGKEWVHAVLPTVQCYPYACGDTPFACKRVCHSKLDCAPGRSCSADGLCLAPI